MKIIIDFDTETKKASIELIKDEIDQMKIYDILPYCMDELYDVAIKESKKEGLR